MEAPQKLKAEMLALRLYRWQGIQLDQADALALIRSARTLERWGEAESGTNNDYGSTHIERDEKTGRPYRVYQPHDSNEYRRTPIPDKETAALKRIADVCKRNNLHHYHQPDPRGAALYISSEPLTDQNYERGAAVI